MTHRVRRVVVRVVHPERLEDAFGEEGVEACVGDGFDDPSEDVGAEVAVHKTGAVPARESGVLMTTCLASDGLDVIRHSSRPAGSPERCVRR